MKELKITEESARHTWKAGCMDVKLALERLFPDVIFSERLYIKEQVEGEIPGLRTMLATINCGRTTIDNAAPMGKQPGSEYVLVQFMHRAVVATLIDKLRTQSPTLDALYKKYAR